jgi:hypothetical protein
MLDWWWWDCWALFGWLVGGRHSIPRLSDTGLQRLKFGVAFGAFARLDQPIFPFTPPTKSWQSDPCSDLHCN